MANNYNFLVIDTDLDGDTIEVSIMYKASKEITGLQINKDRFEFWLLRNEKKMSYMVYYDQSGREVEHHFNMSDEDYWGNFQQQINEDITEYMSSKRSDFTWKGINYFNSFETFNSRINLI